MVLADELLDVARRVDVVAQPKNLFSMADPRTVGAVVAHQLMKVDPIRLSDIQPFFGSGVYAIFYDGDHPVYQAISGTDCPIYVGKAGPENALASTPREQGKKLFGRIKEHRDKSIHRAVDLDISDFSCRYLVTQSGWEESAENRLIAEYRPVWVKEVGVCSGLGKHGDTARTELSEWDVLHAGRKWASGQTSLKGKTKEDVAKAIQNHFRLLIQRDGAARWREMLNKVWVKQQGVDVDGAP